MRISDWSSDVCSSDLPSLPLPPQGEGPRQSSRLKPLLQNLTDPSAAPAFEPATSPPCGKDTVRRPPMSAYRKSPEAIARLTHEQIGRASCRERVCQYV